MIRVLVAGLGNMGLSHALAHHHHPEAQIVGLVNRSGAVDHPDLDDLFGPLEDGAYPLQVQLN